MENTNPKPGLQRNPSLRKKLPPVKQTKGSLLRMIKANPFIAIDEKTKQEYGITDTELKQLGHVGVIQRTMWLKKTINSVSKTVSSNTSCAVQIAKPNNKFSIAEKSNFDISSCYKTQLNGLRQVNKPRNLYQKKTNIGSSKPTSLLNKQKASMRRSKSAERFETKKHFNLKSFSQYSVKTESLENLSTNIKSEDQNVTPSSKTKPFTFKTPHTYRNVFTIPSTSKKFDPKSFQSSTPRTIKVNLNNWLRSRGRSLGSYHHLKCFGIPLEELEEEKENIEIPGPVHSESYKNLGILCENHKQQEEINTKEPNTQTTINYDDIAKDALYDLFTLIQEGYPADQCSDWLKMIREKCNNVENEPTYWECRAALEECYENLPNAIICYRTAIIKGAEVKNVDESLNLLLEKFSLLNIDSNMKGKDCKAKTRIIMDARNVFKSTIIQFAVHERDNKRNEKAKTSKEDSQLLVTPVRRSGRLSSLHRSTPGTQTFHSLKKLSEADNFQFKKNSFLTVRYN